MRDPFYEEVPKFFDMSLKELYSVKHPTAWTEFEEGKISEDVLVSSFFRDGRPFDSEGMKQMMVSNDDCCAVVTIAEASAGCKFLHNALTLMCVLSVCSVS